MIKCEKCLYRKNCQFLATHKNTIVEGCTAFESENDLRIEAAKEFADLAIKRICENVTPIPQQRYLIKMCIEEIENTKKEMAGEMDV
jgi:hypothetical protein